MRDYQLLIFDWDGTLADSVGRIVASMQAAAECLGLLRCSDQQIKDIIGLSLPEAVRTLHPQVCTDRDVELFCQAYISHHRRLDERPVVLFDGVEQALVRWREQGYRLAVATGKSRAALQSVLNAGGWQGYFDITRCADESAGKPNPQMLHEILHYCAVSPERALMVGDASFDLLMAKNAGVDSVAVGFGAQPIELLRRYSPKLAINHFSELQAWLSAKEPAQAVES